MPRFEAHITVSRECATEIKKLVDNELHDWVFSQIDGCPLLGQGVYCYLTGYDQDASRLLFRMNIIINSLKYLGIDPLRSKIERIVYDTKTDINELAST